MDLLNRKIAISELGFTGSRLQRPESVLCTGRGTIYVSNWLGGVTRIDAKGRQTDYVDGRHGEGLKPNGIALMKDGSFLLANLGTEGGVWQLGCDSFAKPWLTEVEGERLPPSNYVMLDRQGRIWITVSTRREPRKLGYRPDVDDGFIVLVDRGQARVVADGLGYTNEVQLHPSGEWLYVNETFARRLSRFAVHKNGSLGARETLCHFGKGTFPDGMAFDQSGALWLTSLVSNRIIRIDNDSMNIIVEDACAQHVDWVEDAFQAGEMDRPHLDTMESRVLKSTSSIAFGGKDLRTAYIGCLLDQKIYSFRAPVAGVQPVHWNWGD